MQVVAAGGIFDSRGLAMALTLGASAVWVGTRFVAAKEAGAPPRHQRGVVNADYHDTVRTIIFTGRPMRVLKNDYIMDWEENKSQEIKELTNKGILPAVQVRKDSSTSRKGGLSCSKTVPLLLCRTRRRSRSPARRSTSRPRWT